MDITFIFLSSLTLFLIGVFSSLFFKNISRIIISLQLIFTAAIINFLGFSQILYGTSIWAVTFMLISVITIFLFQYMIIFYLKSNIYQYKTDKLDFSSGLYNFKINDWLGDD
jgi:NADH:ubiquinone oxidoreductase subunit K